MATLLNPYISFHTTARAAMEFYRSVLGGELTLNTFGELTGEANPADKDLIMHAMLTSPSGLVVMASDTPSSMSYRPGENISISVSGPFGDDAELRGYWDRLAEGATVTEPLRTAMWGDTFGMLTDRFGINWMVSIEAAPAA